MGFPDFGDWNIICRELNVFDVLLHPSQESLRNWCLIAKQGSVTNLGLEILFLSDLFVLYIFNLLELSKEHIEVPLLHVARFIPSIEGICL